MKNQRKNQNFKSQSLYQRLSNISISENKNFEYDSDNQLKLYHQRKEYNFKNDLDFIIDENFEYNLNKIEKYLSDLDENIKNLNNYYNSIKYYSDRIIKLNNDSDFHYFSDRIYFRYIIISIENLSMNKMRIYFNLIIDDKYSNLSNSFFQRLDFFQNSIQLFKEIRKKLNIDEERIIDNIYSIIFDNNINDSELMKSEEKFKKYNK